MNIAVDAMGGDYAPHEIVKGAIKAAAEFDCDITLVGRAEILNVLAGKHRKPHINIVNATQVIEFNEHPVRAIRSKPDSSMVVGIKLLKEGKADAFVSAGNSGAEIVGSMLILGCVEGIERPPLCLLIDLNPAAPVLLVDAGVNADCRPNHLVQFAQLGTVYAQHILGVEKPRVGLVNNGEEETKGNRLAVDAYPLLKQAGVNFIGNIEGHEILRGKADLIVTDGFTGNVILKTIEGMSEIFQLHMKSATSLVSSTYNVQGEDFIRNLKASTWLRRMDYREHGGAYLLGVNGNVVRAHGRSQSRAMKNAIGLAAEAAEDNLAAIIRERQAEFVKQNVALPESDNTVHI